MGKIRQEHYLVVYQNREDLDVFFKHQIEGSVRWKVAPKRNTLTIKPKYCENMQYTWHGVSYEGDCEIFERLLAGYEFAGVRFLDGDYPANVFNYSLYHCRGVVMEVDEI